MKPGADAMRRADAAALRVAGSTAGMADVVLVDVAGDESGPTIRVHLRHGARRPAIPDSVDGIPVIILTTDARLEGPDRQERSHGRAEE